MSLIQHTLPRHLRPCRAKVFGTGKLTPLDREAKIRLMTKARALSRRTEKGKHYGVITAKALDVLQALLFQFHNGKSGRCFPGYERIATAAACARSTVAEAINALEQAGLLQWENRITRIRDRMPDLLGQWGFVWRVVRTSNAYQFADPLPAKPPGSLAKSSKSELPSGTSIQEPLSLRRQPVDKDADLTSPVIQALIRMGKAGGFL